MNEGRAFLMFFDFLNKTQGSEKIKENWKTHTHTDQQTNPPTGERGGGMGV
jgi:hypothetical protein